MNRITLFAQVLGVLIFCIAASAIADPTQGEIKRVLKGSSGDGASSLKGQFKWGDIVLKARAIEPVAGKVLREGDAAKGGPVQFAMIWEWEEGIARPLGALNRAIRGQQSPVPGAIELRGRRIPLEKTLLTEIGFPALDGASKEPAYLTLKMQAEVPPSASSETPVKLERKAPAPAPTPTAPEPPARVWLPANFRLQIGGLNTARVTKFGKTVIKPSAANSGGSRIWGDPHVNELTMPEKDFRAANFVKWEGPDFDASKNEIRPRPGKIVLFDTNGRVLLALNFRLVKFGRIKTTEGGLVKVGFTMDGFELTRN